MATQESSQSAAKLSRAVANELLMMAYREMERYHDLRLGQAIVDVMQLEQPWPELFYEECPVKASEIFYSRVENNGKRELTGKLDISFLIK